MPLDQEQLTIARSWVGDDDPPSDAFLSERYDVLGTVKAVVIETLRKKLAEFVSAPATFSLPGEYTQSHGENIRGLMTLLASAAKQPDDMVLLPGGELIRVQRLRRVDARR